MKLKTELLWAGVFLTVSVLTVGLLNGFSSETIDIQLHDTYYVIHPLHGILLFFFLFLTLRCILFVLAVFCLKQKSTVIVFGIVLSFVLLSMIAFFICISYAYIEYSQRYPTAQEGPSLFNKRTLAFCVLYAAVMAILLSAARRFRQKASADQ